MFKPKVTLEHGEDLFMLGFGELGSHCSQIRAVLPIAKLARRLASWWLWFCITLYDKHEHDRT
jgi:hypothetical protein